MRALIAETFNPKRRVGAEKKLRPIMPAFAEDPREHDGEAVNAAGDDLEWKGATPSVIVADTAYGGDENVEYAAARGIKYPVPVPGNEKRLAGRLFPGKLGNRGNSRAGGWRRRHDGDRFRAHQSSYFKRDEDGKTIRHTSGHKPEPGVNVKGTDHVSVFDFNACLGCSRGDKCPVKIGKRKASVINYEKMIGIVGREHRDTPEFYKNYIASEVALKA
jgi:hypothetical protein